MVNITININYFHCYYIFIAFLRCCSNIKNIVLSRGLHIGEYFSYSISQIILVLFVSLSELKEKY